MIISWKELKVCQAGYNNSEQVIHDWHHHIKTQAYDDKTQVQEMQ